MSTFEGEEAIFNSALDRTGQDRLAYLDQACAGDATFRARIEELLSAYDDGKCLRSPTVQLLMTEPSIQEKPGTVIGPYKLLEQIGEGGMGLVFMAEQMQPIRRRVALKIIKPGLDTRAVIARFEAERQALALMDHPNIARVLDAGATESGRPYFVMELVRGRPITDFCVDNKLSLRERLELFIAVCDAIHHAHQKGIIHRDLKPTNIIVTQTDTAAMPKVIDFGVAKATSQPLTERTLFTAFSQIIGTPLYMSPEQADLSNQDIDTRSDVYSLGVVLYEMLTGTTPFDAEKLRTAGIDEMRRIIREEEPPKPSTRATTVAAASTVAAARKDYLPSYGPLALKGDIDWIVMKALDKDRRRRYDSASGLAADLQRYLRQEPIEARPPSQAYRLRKFAQRNKTMFVAGTIVAASLVLGTVLSTWQAVRATQATQEAQAASEREAKLRNAAEANWAIAEARTFILDKRFDEAEGRLNKIPAEMVVADLAHLGLRRQLGVWHALHERWDKAAENFALVMQLNSVDSDAHITGDYTLYGAVLVMLGDSASYEKFQAQIVSRFLKTKSYQDAERVCKMAVLWPAGEHVMRQLDTLYDVAEKGQSDPTNTEARKSWTSLSLSLVDYRRGDYKKAILRCEHCLTVRGTGFTAAAHAMTAMSYQQLHQYAQARTALALAHRAHQEYTQNVFPSQFAYAAYMAFFDGLVAQSVLREADALVNNQPLNVDAGYAAAQKALGDQYLNGGKYIPQSDAEAARWYRKAADQGLAEAEIALTRMYFTGRGVPKDADEAVKWLRKTAEREDGERLNKLAWSLVANPNPERWDPKSAVVLAEKAVEKKPEGLVWNTLGVAQYRAGHWNAAIVALEKSMELGDSGNGIDWYFLAMAHWQLGNREEARKWFDQAVERTKSKQPQNAMLWRFRDEAAKLIGGPAAGASTDQQHQEKESEPAEDADPAISPAGGR